MAPFEEMVTHPKHYTTGNIEVLDFIVDQKLGYRLGNAIKYICRCNHKGTKAQDIRKAIQYLRFVLNELEGRLMQDDGVSIEPFTQEIETAPQDLEHLPTEGGGTGFDRKCSVRSDVHQRGEEESINAVDRLDSSHCYKFQGPDRNNDPCWERPTCRIYRGMCNTAAGRGYPF